MSGPRDSFDVLVLGGGTAGCVVAARLSEDDDRSVCLVEAGPDYGSYDAGGWPGEMLDARRVPQTHDWGLEGDASLLRARIIGGCSAHNACFVVWGAREDYDEWRGECPGWSFTSIEPHLRAAEERLRTRVPRDEELSPWHHGVMESAAGCGFPRLDDFNDLDAATGVAPIPINAVGPTRWNTCFAYLDAARERENLSVLPETLVDRVLLTGDRAIGAVVRRADADIELEASTMILCAGAYGSPAILMRSGVGPAEHLAELGIEVAMNLPGVGSKLIDHPGVGVYFQPTAGLIAELERHDAGGLLFEGQCAVRARSSACPSALWDLQLLPWASAKPAVQQPVSNLEDELAGPIERIAGPYEVHVTVFALKPASRGEVRLVSRNPDSRPAVRQRFLTDVAGADVSTLCEGVEAVRELAATEPLRALIESEVAPGPGIRSRTELGAWARANVRGFFHPVGTCAMGSSPDSGAVVDHTGRVHGLDGLCVADASIMPTIPRANTNLATVAIAERLADAHRDRS